MTENKTQILTAEMTNLLRTTYQELQNFLVNWSGNLKDIECGTHIKIPIPAGYVSCYKSVEGLNLKLWFSDTLIEKPEEQLDLKPQG